MEKVSAVTTPTSSTGILRPSGYRVWRTEGLTG
jgi:hypothetical protein